MPLVYTSALMISQQGPWRWGWARRQRTAARLGKQMAHVRDWVHHELIGGGGFGERRRRGRGGVPAAARVPARVRKMQGNGWRWKLEWGLGKS
jgi:hypothetical protein